MEKMSDKLDVAFGKALSPNKKKHEEGIKDLFDLSKNKGWKSFVDNPELVELLVDTYIESEDENALLTLVTIAEDSDGSAKLSANVGVVGAFLKAVKDADTYTYGVLGLAFLTNAEENAGRLFRYKDVVNVLVDAAGNGKTSTAREKGIQGLANLARAHENRFPLCNTDGVVAVLVEATKTRKLYVVESALGCLANLADSDENRERLFLEPGVVSAMLNAVNNGNIETADEILAPSDPITPSSFPANNSPGRVSPGWNRLVHNETPPWQEEVTGAATIEVDRPAEDQRPATRVAVTPGTRTTPASANRIVTTPVVHPVPRSTVAVGPVELHERSSKRKRYSKKSDDDGCSKQTSLEAIQSTGLIGLWNLIDTNSINQDKLFHFDGAINALLRVVKSFSDSSANVELSLRILGTLADAEHLGRELFEDSMTLFETLVKEFLNSAEIGSTANIKNLGLNGLVCLASCTQIGTYLFSRKGVVEAFMNAIRKAESTEAVRLGLQGLNNLSDNAQNAVGLLTKWNTLSVLTDLAPDHDSEVALAYVNFAAVPYTRNLINRDENSIRALQQLIERKTTLKATFLAKLALSIIKAPEPKYMSLDSQEDFQMILKLLDAALREESFLDSMWDVSQALVSLRYLTMVPKNRDRLGTQWLSMLRDAINQALEKDDEHATQMALMSLFHYLDDEAGKNALKADPGYLEQLNCVALRATSPAWSSAVETAGKIAQTLGDSEIQDASTDSTHAESSIVLRRPSGTHQSPQSLGRRSNTLSSTTVLPVTPHNHSIPSMTSPVARAGNLPNSADEVLAWAEGCGIGKETFMILSKEGFVNAESLEYLAKSPASEIKDLLGNVQAAIALKLKAELKKLFPH